MEADSVFQPSPKRPILSSDDGVYVEVNLIFRGFLHSLTPLTAPGRIVHGKSWRLRVKCDSLDRLRNLELAQKVATIRLLLAFTRLLPSSRELTAKRCDCH